MDDFDLIETPENVDLQRRLAGIGSRSLAGLIDHLMIAGLYGVLILLFLLFRVDLITLGADAVDQADAFVSALLIFASFLIYWGYFFLFEMWMNGQTPGKKYFKIRVVRQEGGAVTFHAIAIRSLLRAVDFLPALYAVAGITMFVARKSQRLGDLAAGTVVISEELPNYAARDSSKQSVVDDLPATAAALKATHLSPREYRLLHNYWLRRDQLTSEARYRLLPQLLRPILERGGVLLAGGSLATMEKQLEELMKQAALAHPNESPAAPEKSP
jgi:uncharacterized RDD family membrane protein YckC